jgi:hypothetical protein
MNRSLRPRTRCRWLSVRQLSLIALTVSVGNSQQVDPNSCNRMAAFQTGGPIYGGTHESTVNGGLNFQTTYAVTGQWNMDYSVETVNGMQSCTGGVQPYTYVATGAMGQWGAKNPQGGIWSQAVACDPIYLETSQVGPDVWPVIQAHFRSRIQRVGAGGIPTGNCDYLDESPALNSAQPTSVQCPCQAVCPSGAVQLSPTSIRVGGSASAQAPTNWSGGTFASSNGAVASVGGSSVYGVGVGSASISGNSNWTVHLYYSSYPAGQATDCSLGGATLTVTPATCSGGGVCSMEAAWGTTLYA